MSLFRLLSSPFAATLAVASLAVAAGGCTTTDMPDLPDVQIFLDGGLPDVGPDSGLPTPVVDTCVEPGSTLGDTCEVDEDCSDGCFCNGDEQCMGGSCVVGRDPCENELVMGLPMDIPCTEEACLEETNTCFHMPNHAMCSDMLACNGYEICDRNLGCVPAAPLYCNDESSCTVDSCDDTMGCVFTPRDLDGDGYIAGSCGGEDCDDDPRYGTLIFPGASEVCDNRRDDDCDGRRDFTDSDCRPTNDTCDTATILPARSGTYSGSTAGLGGSFTFSCAPGSGPDAVFRLHLDEPHDVRAAVSGTTSPSIVLRNFSQCTSGPDLKCATGSSPSVLSRSLPAGDYAIIVRTSTGGPFDLQLTIGDPTVAPAVDTCTPATVAITSSGTYTGRFEETRDDYSLTCHSGASYQDAAYRLELAADSDVVITASTGAGAQTYLALTTNCSSAASTLTCTTASTAEIRRRGMPAGTYYILIESWNTSAVDWTLNVTITTPPVPRNPGDACSTAVDVPLTGTPALMSGTGMAPLAGAENDGGTSCGGAAVGNRDVFFRFTLTEPRDITLSSTAGSFHYVALETMCGVSGSEIRCRNNMSMTPYSQIFRGLPAGTYYVALATATGAGTASVSIDSRPPAPIPPNDLCSGAINIDPASSMLYRHTLIGFEDDATGIVGSGYPDAFYTFTLTERRMVTLLATPSGTSPIYLILRSGCGSTTNIASATGSGGGPATLVRTLDPGSYMFFVEMPPASATDFTLRTFSDPP